MKRSLLVLSLSTCCVLGLFLLPFPAQANNIEDVPATATPGDTFTAIVAISVSDLNAAVFEIVFDPTVLDLDSGSVTDGLIGGTVLQLFGVMNVGAGRVRIVADVAGLAGASGAGYLCKASFTVIGSAGNSSDIDLENVSLSDTQGDYIIADWQTAHVDITVLAPAISVTPTWKEFFYVDVGASSSPETFTITNYGTADLHVGTMSITGADAGQFSIQNDECSGQSIAPGGSATLKVVFSPTSAGGKLAELSIPSDDPDEAIIMVYLTGGGVGYYDLMENFSQDTGVWTELDPTGKIELDFTSDQRLEFTDWMSSSPGYVSRPYSTQDFVLDFDIHIATSDGDGKVIGPGFSDSLGTIDQIQNGVYVVYYGGTSPGLGINTLVDGAAEWGAGDTANRIGISNGETNYVRLEKSGSTLTLSVFSDQNRTAHIIGSPKSVTTSLSGTTFNYLYAVNGYTAVDNSEWISGWIDNVKVCGGMEGG